MKAKIFLLVAIWLVTIQVCLGQQFQSAITYSDSSCTEEIGISLTFLDTCTPQNCTEFEQTPGQFYKVECSDGMPAVPESFFSVYWYGTCNDNSAQLIAGVSPGKCVTLKDFFSLRASNCYLNGTLFDFGLFANCSTQDSQSTYNIPQRTPETMCYTLTLSAGSLSFIGACPTQVAESPSSTPTDSPASTPVLLTPNSTPALVTPSDLSPSTSPNSQPITSAPVAKTTDTPSNFQVSGAPIKLNALTMLCLTVVISVFL